MPVTAILRGFKVPVAALDRFLRANGVMETNGYAPFYHHGLDDASELLRPKIGDGDSKTRLFIPYRMGSDPSTFAYVAYAWVFVYAQRKLHLLEELPDRAPEGFAELRNEVLGFAPGETEGEQPQPLQDEDVTSMFVTITDERPFRFTEPFVRQFLLFILRNWRIAGAPMEPKNVTMLFQVISKASSLFVGTEGGGGPGGDIIMSGR